MKVCRPHWNVSCVSQDVNKACPLSTLNSQLSTLNAQRFTLHSSLFPPEPSFSVLAAFFFLWDFRDFFFSFFPVEGREP